MQIIANNKLNIKTKRKQSNITEKEKGTEK